MTYDRPSLLSSKSGEHWFNVPKVLYQNRYCDQDDFSVLVCGGRDKNKRLLNQVFKVKFPSFEVTAFPFMEKPHNMLKITTINSDIIAIIDCVELYESFEKSITSIEIYSDKKKTWRHQYVQIEERYEYCLCSFMRQLFIIGKVD